MGVNVDSKFQPNKRYKESGGEDGLSGLPDDILVSILDVLPLKEAARTSVLSPRWAHLWKHTSRLDFSLLDTEKIKEFEHTYLEWVNSVLGSLQGRRAPPLKEFRICICMGPPTEDEITEWLRFAFARQVERLELDNYDCFDRCSSWTHVLSRELLLSAVSCRHHFKTLRALRLMWVSVSQEALEFFFCNCPLLDQLVVHGARGLLNLRVESGSLKRIEMWYCYQLVSLKVSNAPNLTSLSFTPSLEVLQLHNVPMLVDYHLHCGHENRYFSELGPALSCCLMQLEVLTLTLSIPKNIFRSPLPLFPKLKRLVIETLGRRYDETSRLELTSFLRACPNLQEFVVVFCRRLEKKRKEKTQIPAIVRFPHQHLKVFKFVGYSGSAIDVELVRYIFNNCVVLEKIIIDPVFRPIHVSLMEKHSDSVAQQTARIHAKQLEAEIPHHVEFITL